MGQLRSPPLQPPKRPRRPAPDPWGQQLMEPSTPSVLPPSRRFAHPTTTTSRDRLPEQVDEQSGKSSGGSTHWSVITHRGQKWPPDARAACLPRMNTHSRPTGTELPYPLTIRTPFPKSSFPREPTRRPPCLTSHSHVFDISNRKQQDTPSGQLAQLVRAPLLHSGCRGFESLIAQSPAR